jgi:hypothetical protein
MNPVQEIQRIEVPYGEGIHCPFCDYVFPDGSDTEEDIFESSPPCSHTMVISCDPGLVFASIPFRQSNGCSLDEDASDLQFDDLFDASHFPAGATCLESYSPPPGFHRVYVVFAPTQEAIE